MNLQDYLIQKKLFKEKSIAGIEHITGE